MSLLSSIFSDTTSGIVDSVGKSLDSLFTSDEERLKAKNLLEQIKTEAKLKDKEIENAFENEVTKRWVSDNGGFLTRNVRPLSYIFIMALFGFMVLCDGNYGTFAVKDAYIPLIETILVVMTVSYFGSRGAEKITKFIKGK